MTARAFCILLLLTTGLFACKEDIDETPDACSDIGIPHDTVISAGTKYFIITSAGANNEILVEFIYDGICSNDLTIHSLQARKGSNCFESNSFVTMLPPMYKAYKFSAFPAWAIDTTTACILKVSIDSTTYFLTDVHMNL